jgi:hypothetical protein
MRNQPSNPRQSTTDNLTGCLQRYVAFGYERNGKYLDFKINNIVLQIIAREHNFDFHHRKGETCPAKPPIGRACGVNRWIDWVWLTFAFICRRIDPLPASTCWMELRVF